MPAEKTKQQALAALDGMREIVRAEMLVTGEYIEDAVSTPRRAEAVCGGRKHCAIGSLWAGAGVKPDIQPLGSGMSAKLPGVHQEDRPAFMQNRPGLRLAYDSLNDAATAFAAKHDLDLYADDEYDAAIEGLFEGWYGNGLTKADLLKVIAAAKRNVKAA